MTSSEVRRLKWRLRVLGAVLVVMGAASVGQTAWYSWEQQKCNEIFAENLAKRSEWGNQDRTALNEFIVAIFASKRQAEVQEAYVHWRETVTRNDELRDATPLPDLADCD